MNIQLYQYRFPFKQTFVTASDSYTEREGIIFILRHKGIEAYGEAAPLPGFSGESLHEVRRYLAVHNSSFHAYIREAVQKYETGMHHLLPVLPSSLAFGLDTLLADYWSKAKQVPLPKMLFKKSRSQITVNATLPIDKKEALLARALAYREAGYRTIKLKVGADFSHELAVIKALRSRFPDLNIRIDANQGWSPEEAANQLDKLTPLRIEYCEEPLKQPTPAGLAKLRQSVTIPIALDESLYCNKDVDDWIKSRCADILVVKPMVLGGFKSFFETFRLADNHDYKLVVTTSLEGGIGRMMTAILAAGAGSTALAQGLATGNRLALDVWNDQPYIKNGTMHLPEKEGLGMQFNPEKLAPAVKKIEL
ncbi:o-succinylbenzoate synthase [Halalkalibaculum sp. DA3122]|uniref:o-succinylbenzoate synthase n=1 Tax=unclassified Halalkalibaculum TaxID=2964617 RepID=UPI0037547641